MVRIIWSWCGHKFDTCNDGELDGLGYTPDAFFPSWWGHLQQSSIVSGGQEGVGPNVENIAAVGVILAQVAEHVYCP